MRHFLFGSLGFLAAISSSFAITIQIDYSLDRGYFSGAAAGSEADKAKKTIEKAAQDLNDALNNELATLNGVPTMTFYGSDPGRKLLETIVWDLKVPDPVDPDPTTPYTISDFTLADDTFVIFAGRAPSLDNTETLGQGAPSTATLSLAIDEDLSDEPAATAALQSMVNYSNGILLRGAGPTITQVDEEDPANQVALPSGAVVKLPLKFGALAGFLTFNATLKTGEEWNFDFNQMPAANQYDLYTVMLHEMMHTLGMGTSTTWESKATNDKKDWSGSNATAANGGSGAGLIHADGSHIKNGTMSEIVGTDTAQEAVMTAALAKGVRRKLTKLDIAFLKDLGYGPATAAPTPPPTPTPTPSPTPEATPVPVAPEKPILAGPARIKSTKPKVKLGGSLLSSGAYVMYKVDKGRFLKARGGNIWSINLTLKPGKHTVTIVSFDPVTGLTSPPKKITIIVAKKKPTT